MYKLKNNLIVTAISALVVELVYPAFIPAVAQASPLPQFDIVSVRLDRTMASNSGGTPATVMYSGGTVCVATPASGTFSTIPNAGAETDVEIGFPAEQGAASGPNVISSTNDFHVKPTPANWLVNTTDPSGGTNTGQNYFPLLDGLGSETAWPGLVSPAVAAQDTAYSPGDVTSKRIVRFTMTAMAAAHDYCFNFKDGTGTTGAETSSTFSLQLPDLGTNGYQENVPGFITTYKCTASCSTLGAGTPVMSSNWGTQITSASTTACSVAPCNDYYVVTAVVPPLLIFKLDHNADSFITNLDPNQSVPTTGVTATVQTNAKGGWIMWTKDTNQGLSSASSGGHIPTVTWNSDAPTTIYTSPTQPVNALYGLVAIATSNVGGVTSCGASNTPAGAKVEPEYAGSSTSPVAVGAFTQDWSEVADCSASTAGTDGGSTVNLKEDATITFSTPAATDYTDTVYVAAAGEF